MPPNTITKRFEEKRRRAEESGDISLLNALLKEKRKLLKGQRMEDNFDYFEELEEEEEKKKKRLSYQRSLG